MGNLLFAAALLLCVGGAYGESSTTFQFAEKPGHYSVGLKVVQQYDFSRTYRPKVDALGKLTVGERARPLQTLVWYPAEKSSEEPMTVANYSELLASETTFEKPQTWGEMKSWVDGMKPTLNDSLWARRDARALARKFPLVIYAPSFSAMSWENVDLCEYLATHGYVVIASASLGARGRVMTRDLEGVDAQARDISFLIAYARTLPNTDMAEIAVAGFSWEASRIFLPQRVITE